MFFDRAQFCQLVSWLNDAQEISLHKPSLQSPNPNPNPKPNPKPQEHIDLPPPTILKPVELWTGKQVWSVMIRPQRTTNLFVTFTVKTKIAGKWNGHPDEAFMEEEDGWVVFQNSELLCGTLNKEIMGGGKKSLLYVLLRTYGPSVACSCMNRIAKISARFLGNFGFSIGIN